jgi:hypothetical protein
MNEDFSQKASDKNKICGCSSTDETSPTSVGIQTQKLDAGAAPSEVRYISTRLGYIEAGDCSIRGQDIVIYEDGRVTDIASLYDLGTVFGDQFTVTIILLDASKRAITSYKWSVDVDPGPANYGYRSPRPDPEIVRSFGEIAFIRRRLECDPNIP